MKCKRCGKYPYIIIHDHLKNFCPSCRREVVFEKFLVAVGERLRPLRDWALANKNDFYLYIRDMGRYYLDKENKSYPCGFNLEMSRLDKNGHITYCRDCSERQITILEEKINELKMKKEETI